MQFMQLSRQFSRLVSSTIALPTGWVAVTHRAIDLHERFAKRFKYVLRCIYRHFLRSTMLFLRGIYVAGLAATAR
jgi:hypothetical protein